MTKNIYIAGPMTGQKYFNFHSFDKAAKEYRLKGYNVFSPADHDRELLGRPKSWLPEETDSEGPWIKWSIEGAPSLRRMLGDDLEWIAKNADAIHMLKGWENSKGARAEHALAHALSLEIIYE